METTITRGNKMKTIEYKDRFLSYMKNAGVDYRMAVIDLESSIECFGYSDDPENDALEALSVWEQNS